MPTPAEIQTLASHRPGRMATIADLQQTIASLEAELGEKPSQKIYNIVRAKSRVEELSRMRDRIASAAPLPTTPPPAANLAKLRAVYRELFAVDPSAEGSEAQQIAAIAHRIFTTTNVELPSLAAEFAALRAAGRPRPEMFGLNRAAWAMQQPKVDAILKKP